MPNNSLFQKQHISFKMTPELRQLCQPLLSLIEVDYFYYLRYLDDNRIILLTMTPSCAKYLVEHNLIPDSKQLKPGIYYLPSNLTNKTRLQVSEHFKLHHNLEFIQNTSGGIEL